MEEATERKCEMASPELFGALRASLELSLIKAVASKFGGNPRSQKPAVGVLTVSASIPESARRLFHLAIDAIVRVGRTIPTTQGDPPISEAQVGQSIGSILCILLPL